MGYEPSRTLTLMFTFASELVASSNLRRPKAKTKVLEDLTREYLFADGCVLGALYLRDCQMDEEISLRLSKASTSWRNPVTNVASQWKRNFNLTGLLLPPPSYMSRKPELHTAGLSEKWITFIFILLDFRCHDYQSPASMVWPPASMVWPSRKNDIW